MLHYSYSQVVLQEVPDEISLAISISGCPMKCKGCHSSFTWKKKLGKKLTSKEMKSLINKNKHITCVLFYGGDWDIIHLKRLIKIVKDKNLKVCLYTGRELNYFDFEFISSIDYIKTGRYIEKLGGITSNTTNQKFFEINSEEIIEKEFPKKVVNL